MKSQYVKDVAVGTEIDDYFAVNTKGAVREIKSGERLWFSIEISDRTGAMPLKFWGEAGRDKEVRDLFASFDVGDVVRVKGGKTSTYENRLEVSLNQTSGSLEKMKDGYDTQELVLRSEKDVPKMIARLEAEIKSIKDGNIRRLLGTFFDDKEFVRMYAESPASRAHHHGYVGGLIEHVLSMIEIAKTVADQYAPDLDKDLMVTGCILHDIGKVHEYRVGASIDHTVRGSLIGHIPMGARMVAKKIEGIDGFPAELGDKIIHMVLSHHGSQEAGSPVTPRFPEALALHKIDDCDAQTKFSVQERKKHAESTGDEMAWSGRQLGYMYLK